MKVLHRRSTKRVAALGTAFATAAFIVQLAAPSAWALPPAAIGSYFPTHVAADTLFTSPFTASTDVAVLSDKADGVDSLAHLTAVSSHGDTTVVQWYFCDAGLFPPSCPSSGKIGEDTTATTPGKTSGYGVPLPSPSIDDAWSITWDIPSSLDGLEKDIVVEGCNLTPDASFSNCVKDVVPDVLLDDAGSGNNPQTSSGEITSPAHGTIFAREASNTLKASTSAVTTVPITESTAVAFGLHTLAGSGDGKNQDGTAGAADPAGDTGAVNGGASTNFVDLTPDSTTATAKTWSATVPAGTIAADAEVAVTLYSTNADMDTVTAGTQAGGVVSDKCNAVTTPGHTCTDAVGGMAFDRHYVVAEPGVPGTTSQVYLKQTSDVTADPTCKTGPTTIAAAPGSTVSLTGCTFDAFGTAVGSEGVAWALLAGGTGFFTATPPTTTGTNGQAVATVSAPASAAGTNTTVSFCLDHDKNGSCDSALPALNASVTISWGAAGATHARNVSLRLSDALRARGRVTVTGGFAACASKVPVKVQKKKAGGGWRTVKSVTTSATGGYTAKLRNRHGTYRALAPRVTKGTDVCKRAVSPKRRH